MAENSGMELAKAYVQIIPSMQGMEGRLGQLLDEEMGNAGDSAGSSLGKKLISKAAGIISAAALGKVVADSFMEGAALEQSLGGVETMFKENADKVIQNADKAYKTAGRSANDYMETVTGFSAALIKSLGGDTAAAVDYADMAIVDMSDNVNKFGGDIESLTNAYSGFAKQNYTMLDNLKLGYGGTKEEMERLIADANNLKKANGEMADLTIDSYGDIIEAIHLIQEDLDVTGTTAEEASSTFSGSFAAMTAAAKNLEGTLTAGGDVSQAVKELEDTSLTFGQNALEMMENIENGLVGDNKALEDIIVTSGVFAVSLKVIGALSASTFATTALSVDVLSGKMLGLMVNGELAFGKLAASGGVAAAAIAGVALAGKLVADQIDKAAEAIDEAYDPAEHLGEKFTQISASASEAADNVARIKTDFDSNIFDIRQENEGYSAMIKRLGELNKVQNRTNEEQSEFTALVDEINDKYPSLGLEIDANTGQLNKNKAAIDSVTSALAKQEEAEEARSNMSDLYSAREKAEKAYNDALENRNALIASNADMTSDAAAAVNTAYLETYNALQSVNDEIEKANSIIAESDAAEKALEKQQEAFEKNSSYAKQAVADMKDYVATLGDETYNISQDTFDKIQELTDKYGEAVRAQEEAISSSLDVFGEFNGGTETTAQELIDNLDANQKGLEDWAANLRTLAEWGIDQGLLNTLEEAGPSSASKVQAMIDMGKPKMREYSKQWSDLQGEIHTIAEQQSDDVLEQTTQMIGDMIGIADKGKDGAKDEYRELADMVIEGYADGIRTGTDQVIVPVTAEMVQKAIQAAKEEAGIASPSKVFRQLGLYNDEGFANGMTDGTDDVVTAAVDMVQSAIGAAKKAGAGLAELFPDTDKLVGSRSDDLLSRASKQDSGSLSAFSDKDRSALVKPAVPDTRRDSGGSARWSESSPAKYAEIKLLMPGSSGQMIASWLLPYLDIELGRSVTITARTGGRT